MWVKPKQPDAGPVRAVHGLGASSTSISNSSKSGKSKALVKSPFPIGGEKSEERYMWTTKEILSKYET